MEDSETNTGLEHIVWMALLLIAIIVIVLFIYRAITSPQDRMAVETCKRSVDLASVHVAGTDVFDSLECEAREVRITDSDQKAIKRKVAEQMADCWYKFDKGESELFEKNWGKDRFCAVCSIIEFEGAADNRKITGFAEYIATENVKQAYGRGTYADYLTSEKTTDLDKFRKQPLEIDTSKDYGVIFVYDKNAGLDKFWGAVSFGSGAGMVALTTGVIASGTLLPILPVAGVAALIGTGVGAAVGGPAQYSAVTVLMPYSAQSFDSLNCEHLPVKQKNR
jgi:hypothetical protein